MERRQEHKQDQNRNFNLEISKNVLKQLVGDENWINSVIIGLQHFRDRDNSINFEAVNSRNDAFSTRYSQKKRLAYAKYKDDNNRDCLLLCEVFTSHKEYDDWIKKQQKGTAQIIDTWRRQQQLTDDEEQLRARLLAAYAPVIVAAAPAREDFALEEKEEIRVTPKARRAKIAPTSNYATPDLEVTRAPIAVPVEAAPVVEEQIVLSYEAFSELPADEFAALVTRHGADKMVIWKDVCKERGLLHMALSDADDKVVAIQKLNALFSELLKQPYTDEQLTQITRMIANCFSYVRHVKQRRYASVLEDLLDVPETHGIDLLLNLATASIVGVGNFMRADRIVNLTQDAPWFNTRTTNMSIVRLMEFLQHDNAARLFRVLLDTLPATEFNNARDKFLVVNRKGESPAALLIRYCMKSEGEAAYEFVLKVLQLCFNGDIYSTECYNFMFMADSHDYALFEQLMHYPAGMKLFLKFIIEIPDQRRQTDWIVRFMRTVFSRNSSYLHSFMQTTISISTWLEILKKYGNKLKLPLDVWNVRHMVRYDTQGNFLQRPENISAMDLLVTRIAENLQVNVSNVAGYMLVLTEALRYAAQDYPNEFIGFVNKFCDSMSNISNSTSNPQIKLMMLAWLETLPRTIRDKVISHSKIKQLLQTVPNETWISTAPLLGQNSIMMLIAHMFHAREMTLDALVDLCGSRIVPLLFIQSFELNRIGVDLELDANTGYKFYSYIMHGNYGMLCRRQIYQYLLQNNDTACQEIYALINKQFLTTSPLLPGLSMLDILLMDDTGAYAEILRISTPIATQRMRVQVLVDIFTVNPTLLGELLQDSAYTMQLAKLVSILPEDHEIRRTCMDHGITVEGQVQRYTSYLQAAMLRSIYFGMIAFFADKSGNTVRHYIEDLPEANAPHMLQTIMGAVLLQVIAFATLRALKIDNGTQLLYMLLSLAIVALSGTAGMMLIPYDEDHQSTSYLNTVYGGLISTVLSLAMGDNLLSTRLLEDAPAPEAAEREVARPRRN